MARFVLVDLHDQVAFLPREVLTSPEVFLSWLKLFGEVGDWPRYEGGQRVGDSYAFRSSAGLETSFYFDGEGKLHVDRDQSIVLRVFLRSGLLIKWW